MASKPCAGRCVLDCSPSAATRKKKEAAEKTPKKAKVENKTHHSTGDVVTAKSIPQWRARPRGPEPWVQATCGIVTSGAAETDTARVTCRTCLRMISGSAV